MNTEQPSPNQALQRTAPAVTLAASAAALPPTAQPSRPPPPSLSLGSLGDYAHAMIGRFMLPLTSLVFMSGCAVTDRTSTTASTSCSLDFQTYFSSDRVAVFADGVRVFSGSFTTEPVTGVAKHLTIPTHGPSLQLRIETPTKGVLLAKRLVLQQGRYLGITRDVTTGRFTLKQQMGMFLYD